MQIVHLQIQDVILILFANHVMMSHSHVQMNILHFLYVTQSVVLVWNVLIVKQIVQPLFLIVIPISVNHVVMMDHV
ncbi:hypothetical protein A2500_03345 [Candidatus Falkowbacteria bacterium RIFOXYC12_FULL_34_55]|nr:MAG: hypothetical protein A2500_03345 [Candidatus Falkowbacteria bacterium RIFOXYC12_FULL_34_55]